MPRQFKISYSNSRRGALERPASIPRVPSGQWNIYTKPQEHNRLKNEILNGSNGGARGQWSVRKAQLLASAYEKIGGGYTGRRSRPQRTPGRLGPKLYNRKKRDDARKGKRTRVHLPAKAWTRVSAFRRKADNQARIFQSRNAVENAKTVSTKSLSVEYELETKAARRKIRGLIGNAGRLGGGIGSARRSDIDVPTGGVAGIRRVTPDMSLVDVDSDGWAREGTANPVWVGINAVDKLSSGKDRPRLAMFRRDKNTRPVIPMRNTEHERLLIRHHKKTYVYGDKDVFGRTIGRQHRGPRWLDGLTNKQIATVLIPSTREQHRQMWIDGEPYTPGTINNFLNFFDEEMARAYRQVDYSPAAIREMRAELESALNNSPLLAWSFRTHGAPIFAMLTPEAVDAYMDLPHIVKMLEERIKLLTTANPNIAPEKIRKAVLMGTVVKGSHSPGMGAVVFNPDMIKGKPVRSINLKTFEAAWGVRPSISKYDDMPDSSTMSMDDSVGGTIRHEYGHWLHNMAQRQAEISDGPWRPYYLISNSNHALSVANEYNSAESFWDKESPSIDIQTVSDSPRTLTRYGYTNLREMFAEGFSAVTHPNPEASRTLINAKLRNDVETILGAGRGQKPWLDENGDVKTNKLSSAGKTETFGKYEMRSSHGFNKDIHSITDGIAYDKNGQKLNNIVLYHEGSPVGFLSWSQEDGAIRYLAVLDKHKDRGLGKRMLKMSQKISQDSDMTSVKVSRDISPDGDSLLHPVLPSLPSTAVSTAKLPRFPRQPTYGAFIGSAVERFKDARTWERFERIYNDTEVIFFDYETTGLVFDKFGESSSNGQPLQFGAVKMRNGKVIDSINLFMNPEEPLGDWSKANLKDMDGNPLADEWLLNQPSMAAAHQRLAEFAGPDAIFGVQNAVFDKNVLDDALAAAGIDWRPGGYLDTKEIADMVLPKWSEDNQDGPFLVDGKTGEKKASTGLAAITKYLEVDLGEKHHTADADAEATGKVMSAIIEGAIKNDWPSKVLDGDLRVSRAEKKDSDFGKAVEKFRTEKAKWIEDDASARKLSSARASRNFVRAAPPDAPRAKTEDRMLSRITNAGGKNARDLVDRLLKLFASKEYPEDLRPYRAGVNVSEPIVAIQELVDVFKGLGHSSVKVDGSVAKILGPVIPELIDLVGSEEDIQYAREWTAPQADEWAKIAALSAVRQWGIEDSLGETIDTLLNRPVLWNGEEKFPDFEALPDGNYGYDITSQMKSTLTLLDSQGNVAMRIPPGVLTEQDVKLLSLGNLMSWLSTLHKRTDGDLPFMAMVQRAIYPDEDLNILFGPGRAKSHDIITVFRAQESGPIRVHSSQMEFADSQAGEFLKGVVGRAEANNEHHREFAKRYGQRVRTLLAEAGLDVDSPDVKLALTDAWHPAVDAVVLSKEDGGRFVTAAAMARNIVTNLYAPAWDPEADSYTTAHEFMHIITGQGFTRHGELAADVGWLGFFGEDVWPTVHQLLDLQGRFYDMQVQDFENPISSQASSGSPHRSIPHEEQWQSQKVRFLNELKRIMGDHLFNASPQIKEGVGPKIREINRFLSPWVPMTAEELGWGSTDMTGPTLSRKKSDRLSSGRTWARGKSNSILRNSSISAHAFTEESESGDVKMHQIVKYNGRPMILANISIPHPTRHARINIRVPFFMSIGEDNRDGIPIGRWYPFFGITSDNHLRKLGDKNSLVNYYNSSELRSIAERLDASLSDTGIGKYRGPLNDKNIFEIRNPELRYDDWAAGLPTQDRRFVGIMNRDVGEMDLDIVKSEGLNEESISKILRSAPDYGYQGMQTREQRHRRLRQARDPYTTKLSSGMDRRHTAADIKEKIAEIFHNPDDPTKLRVPEESRDGLRAIIDSGGFTGSADTASATAAVRPVIDVGVMAMSLFYQHVEDGFVNMDEPTKKQLAEILRLVSPGLESVPLTQETVTAARKAVRDFDLLQQIIRRDLVPHVRDDEGIMNKRSRAVRDITRMMFESRWNLQGVGQNQPDGDGAFPRPTYTGIFWGEFSRLYDSENRTTAAKIPQPVRDAWDKRKPLIEEHARKINSRKGPEYDEFTVMFQHTALKVRGVTNRTSHSPSDARKMANDFLDKYGEYGLREAMHEALGSRIHSLSVDAMDVERKANELLESSVLTPQEYRAAVKDARRTMLEPHGHGDEPMHSLVAGRQFRGTYATSFGTDHELFGYAVDGIRKGLMAEHSRGEPSEFENYTFRNLILTEDERFDIVSAYVKFLATPTLVKSVINLSEIRKSLEKESRAIDGMQSSPERMVGLILEGRLGEIPDNHIFMDIGPDEDTSDTSQDMKNVTNAFRAVRIKNKKIELAHTAEVISRKVKTDAYKQLMASSGIELATESRALETIKSATPLVTQEATKIISLFPLGLINAEGDSGTPQSRLTHVQRTDKYVNRKLVVKINTKQGRAHAQWIPHMSRWSSTGEMEEGGEYTQLKLNKMPAPNDPSYPKWRSTLIHELVHSMENANPQLKMWEYAFWTHRRKGEKLQKLKKLTGWSYGPSEVAIKDEWPDAYSGRFYGTYGGGLPEQQNYEILSTGLERLLGNKSWNDPEYEAFVMGILMLANRLEVAWEKPESLPEPPGSSDAVRFNRE